MVHRIKTKMKVEWLGRPKLKIEVKGTTARAKKMEWTVTKKGKTYTAKRKTMTWSVKPKTQYRIDVGARGKGRKVFKIKRKGALRRLGYSAKAPSHVRREALRKADKLYGSRSVWNMLHAQTVFRRRYPDGVKEAFESDADWVMKNLMSEKERIAMTKPAVKEWKGMTTAERIEARK